MLIKVNLIIRFKNSCDHAKGNIDLIILEEDVKLGQSHHLTLQFSIVSYTNQNGDMYKSRLLEVL